MTETDASKKETNLQHLKILCAQFHRIITQGKIRPCLSESKALIDPQIGQPNSDLNEAQIRQSFILPLVSTLGWNVEDPFEVYPEERINGGFVDIRLRLPSGESLIWEIKRASVSLDLGTEEGKDAAYQGVGYSRTFTNSPYCIVSNFETTLIFHSYSLPSREKIVDNLIAKFSWLELKAGKADEVLTALSRPSLESKETRKFFDSAIKNKKILKSTRPLEERILSDLEKWRLVIANELYRASGEIDLSKVDVATQVVINRILFIRCCEDRKLESEARIQSLIESKKIWKILTEKTFPYFQASYNSDLFQNDKIADDPELEFDDKKLKSILEETFKGTGTETHEIYDFSIIPLEILGAAYESYLAKQLVKEGRGLKLDLKPELKKSGGVCYTPNFIVEEIVRKTIGQIEYVSGKKFLPKVLDPACGSGTFLIQALRFLFEKNRPEPLKKSEKKKSLSLKEKREVIEKCIFGVDLDQKAVEITKLSLLLLLLEGEQEGLLIKSALLPSLDKNLRYGNSLVSPESALKYLKDPNLDKLKPLDWESFKKNVGANSGFDVVIGNPPYVRIQVLQEFYPQETIVYCSEFETAKDGNVDLYLPFLEQAIRLSRKSGFVGFILPSRFWTNDYGKNARKLISKNKLLKEIINFRAEQVFKGVTTYTCILILSRNESSDDFNLFEPPVKQLAPEVFVSKLNRDTDSCKHLLRSEILKEEPWLLAPTVVRNRIHVLEKSETRLKNYIDVNSGVFQGLINGKDSVFLLESHGRKIRSPELNRDVEIESDLIFPILKGSADLKRFETPSPDLRILFPYKTAKNGEAILIEPSELKKNYPKAFKYLKDVEMSLRYRPGLKTKIEREKDLERNPRKFKDPDDPSKLKWYYEGEDFYKFSRNQALNCVRHQKLIVPSLFKEPAFFWDKDGEFALTGSGSGGGGAYAMYLKKGCEHLALSIVGILNSNVLQEWFERRGDLFAGYYIGVDEKILLEAPLPNLSSKSVKVDLDLLTNLVGRIFKSSTEEISVEIMGSIDNVVRRLFDV